MIAAAAAVLLIAGAWTPLAGAGLAFSELGLALVQPDPGPHFVLAALGAGLAMLGPGAWSVDARLFGRRRIDIPEQ